MHHLSQKLNLPFVASNAPLYAEPAGRMLQDVFTCLRHHTHLDLAGRILELNTERHLKSERDIRQLFPLQHEALENSQRIAERIEFSMEQIGYRFPDFPVPDGTNMTQFLHQQTYNGARKRYPRITPRIRQQLDHELRIINHLGFPGYFLIVWDLVRYAREQGILVQGRGSAANSAVCYSLSITAVDPIESKLLFERFLSESREAWPDIDLDLPSGNARENVIQEVYRRFAPHGAAMTANVITYRGRSAMREVGKALNLPEDVLGRYSELFASGDFPHTLKFMDQVEQAGLPREHPRLPALVHLYQKIYGLPRHLGQHSGGMVICNQGLHTIVPLEPASMPGRTVLQWDKDDCEDLGMVKIDLLGLGMMAVVQDSIALCSQRPNRAFDLARIPKDDPSTFDLLQKAETIGVFQVESRAQMATLPRLNPKTFYDLCVEVAIVRPGPIVGNLVHPYLNRRNGKEPITYLHPDVEPVLERTLGVPLFQEQVLKMAMILADFTGSEAEQLRRALGFHRNEERLNEVATKLRAAMAKKGHGSDLQEKMIDSIRSFALYGFPESHAISFALIAYASAWMKVHRAAEFFASLLNNQPMGFYSSDTLLKDARRRGLKTLPVNVIESAQLTTVIDDHTLRLGLHAVHGLSSRSAIRIVEQRELQAFSHIDDFLLRTRLAKNERRALAEVGALNGLAAHRRDALWQVEQTPDPDDLFLQPQPRTGSNSPLPPMSPLERMRADYDHQHLSTGPHPMTLLRPHLAHAYSARELQEIPHGKSITIAGMVICRQRPGTAKGHVFISLEDETGISNAFVPSPTFEEYRLIITQEHFLEISGDLQNVDNVRTLYAKRIKPLSQKVLNQSLSHDFH